MDKFGNNNGNQQHNTCHYVVIKTYYAIHDEKKKTKQPPTNPATLLVKTGDNWKGRHGNLGAQVIFLNTRSDTT